MPGPVDSRNDDRSDVHQRSLAIHARELYIYRPRRAGECESGLLVRRNLYSVRHRELHEWIADNPADVSTRLEFVAAASPTSSEFIQPAVGCAGRKRVWGREQRLRKSDQSYSSASDERKFECSAPRRDRSGVSGGRSELGSFSAYSCVGDSHSCVNTVTGGGIYVQGSAGVVLTAGRDGQGNPTQTYSITQGGTVTTVTTNISTNSTVFSSGGNTLTLTGVPENTLGANPQPATMLYVNGTISSLAGPSQELGRCRMVRSLRSRRTGR